MQTKACLQGTQQEFFSDCLEKLITLVAGNFGLEPELLSSTATQHLSVLVEGTEPPRLGLFTTGE